MKLAYTQKNGQVAIVYADTKADLEKCIFGPMTNEQFRQHVFERSIPPDATDTIELPDDWERPTGQGQRHLWRLRDGKVIVEKE